MSDDLMLVPSEGSRRARLRSASSVFGCCWSFCDSLPLFEDRISDHDIIGYTAENQNFSNGQFSSNFLAGRKGSVVMGAIWKAQKEQLGGTRLFVFETI